MSKLRIEQLTEQVELTKTAEEAEITKLAEVANVVEQAQTLSLVGEELFKIAEELDNDEFRDLAADVYQLGERMGSALSKTASESSAALEDSLEIAEDLNKIASVVASIADEAENEEFNKLAEAVITISNEMTDEANAVLEEIEKEAGVKEIAKNIGEKFEKHLGGHNIKEYLRKTTKETVGEGGYGEKLHEKLKYLLGHEKGRHALGKDVIPHAGIAAALAGAGYGVHHHMHNEKHIHHHEE